MEGRAQKREIKQSFGHPWMTTVGRWSLESGVPCPCGTWTWSGLHPLFSFFFHLWFQ